MLVFFYLADHEILELSVSKTEYSKVVEILNRELRLLILLIAMDDCVVLSPSHYRELDICRALVKSNQLFIDDGWLGLLMREFSLQENKDKQAKRYGDYKNVPKYYEAYLTADDYGLSKFGFKIFGKDFQTGKKCIDIWESKIRDSAKNVKFSLERLNEFILRVRDNKDAPFIWERVKAILNTMNFTLKDESLLKIRANMSTSYIESHKAKKIILPRGSMVIPEKILPKIEKGNAYDLMKFHRVLELLGVFDNVIEFNPKKILTLKIKIPHIIDEIRKGIESEKTSEQIFSTLNDMKLVKEFQDAVRGLNSLNVYKNINVPDIESFIETQNKDIDKLAGKFIHYQGEQENKVDKETIKRFLRQFETKEKIKMILTLLMEVNFINRNRLNKMFEHYYTKYLEKEGNDKIILTNIGSPYDSSRLVSYVCGDIAMKNKLKGQELRSILDKEESIDKIIVFVDDNIGCGKQATDIFRELLGLTKEKKLKEKHEIELTDSQKEKLKKFRLKFFTCVGLEDGKNDFVKELRKMGLNMEDSYSFIKEESDIGCFHNACDIFDSSEERAECEKMCREIGYQLFADKNNWDEEKKKENSLGYGNSQKLIVFYYNVPTTTLTLLWKYGKYKGKLWSPLFPRREKK